MKRTLFFACLSLLAACQKQAGDNPSAQFELLSPQRTGIDFVQTITEEYRYNFSQDPNIFNGGGVAVLDVNRDGLQDLFFTSRLQPCRLYLNKGNFQFEDISKKSGVADSIGIKTGVAVADVNADGWDDLYVCRTFLEPIPQRRNLLFINNHDNTFSEKAAEFGLDDLSPTQHATFFDYDLDGDLDCYVLNHPVTYREINAIDFQPTAQMPRVSMRAPRDEFESDKLFRNDGGKFTEVGKQAGVFNRAWGLSVMSNDFNDDGYPDLYVANDFIMPDFLYINNGDGTFTERHHQYFRTLSNHTMGIEIADLNNDALPDLVALDMLGENWERRRRQLTTMQLERHRQLIRQSYGDQQMRNVLQLAVGRAVGSSQMAVGSPRFAEIGCLAGIFATEWGWSPLAADFDNDGGKDLFITNGVRRDLNDLDFFVFTADSINRTGGISPQRFQSFEDFSSLMPSEKVRNRMFRNTGSLQMQDVTDAWGFSTPTFSNGAAYADLDNDGDLDLVVHNVDDPPFIYQNKAAQNAENHWLQIKCKGTAKNPAGVGAKIWVWAGGQVFYQEMTPVRGFYSSSEVIFQVGLGKFSQADEVAIEWLGSKHQVLKNVPANQCLILDIAAAQPGRLPKTVQADSRYFREITEAVPLFNHQENAFEDFDRERLLPHRFSKTGPSLAVGDLDSDGLEDFFIGGTPGQVGTTFFQNSALPPQDGISTLVRFYLKKQPALKADQNFEDTGSLLFDADGDGDLDLYVVSGGNELPAGDPGYQDRLYLNDGKGNFTRSKTALPAETASGSKVAAHDFDGDGDLDLFVGGQVTPGAYPQAPQSFILRNDTPLGGGAGGVKFTEVTAVVAPDFQRIGMVNDLVFADLDADGKAELIVTGEWLSLQIFKLQNARFINYQPSLINQKGWWNCLAAADLDGDGDLDLAAGNLGLNTRYRTSKLHLYAKDFDGNGSTDPVLCVEENGRILPVAMRDNLVKQLPGLRKKFVRNTPYSKAAIEQVFSAADLQSAQHLQAQTLASAWFENQNGKFVMHLLPDEAQLSPVKKIQAADFTGDGKIDLLLAGNDTGYDVETGPLHASPGCLLVNEGKGNFKALLGTKTGFFTPDEVRDVAPVRVSNGKTGWLVANNGDRLQLFEQGF